MEQAVKATISLSTAAAAGCCMAACPYRRYTLRRRSRSVCSSSSSLRHAPSAAARVHATASTSTSPEPNKTKKEKDLVFVAGATGKVGSRAVRELIKLGFRVRAGVRSAQRASSLVQSVEQLKLDDATSPAEKLELVECDLEKQPQADIVSAIGNAEIVVCSIGASEKDILDVTGPYRIDYIATNNLVQAATAAKVEHFILVTSLGTNRIGFPAFLLNLFWGVLCWKRRAEEALISSGLPYTIVRPGGMERPTDAFKETHNLVVAAEDTYVGGLVSNLQVAELIACMASNRKVAYCKVVEAVAETTAPLQPMEDQLFNIPSNREPLPELDVKEGEIKLQAPPKPISNEKTGADQQRPLSPYTAFVELKPPSSPSPSPPTTAPTAAPAPDSPGTGAEASSAVLDSSATGNPISRDGDKLNQQRPLSPYTRYEELKPPSSPSPSPPSAASTVSASPHAPAAAEASSTAFDSRANGIPITGDQISQQQRPLSPYTRYEDLKPPSSPTPSAPKL
uniref:NAD(P)-binding domain-containing protein n=1 Tax=Leersia perrieri TaxID=77586 RepID=A0A0D9XH61_9ORYZ